jgi:hypothetical protein
MVISRHNRRDAGWVVAELMFAVTVIIVALIPLAFSFRAEQRLVRANYNQVVAMEIVDGEMEFLHAGAWRNYLDGEQPYKVSARAATNLPPGGFFLTRSPSALRLEWRPIKKGSGGKIVREVALPKNSD